MTSSNGNGYNNVIDNIIDKARDVCDLATKKTTEVVESSKIKLDCVRVNGEIKKLYEKLGSTVYSMMRSNYENKELVDSLAEEIDEELEKLKLLNEKLSDVKNVNFCNVCGAKNPTDNYFCSKCGSRIRSEFTGYDPVQQEGADAFEAIEGDCEEKDNAGE